MPVTSRSGAPLSVGDVVIVPCFVELITELPNQPELTLATLTPMYPGEAGTRLLLRGEQVELVDSPIEPGRLEVVSDPGDLPEPSDRIDPPHNELAPPPFVPVVPVHEPEMPAGIRSPDRPNGGKSQPLPTSPVTA